MDSAPPAFPTVAGRAVAATHPPGCDCPRCSSRKAESAPAAPAPRATDSVSLSGAAPADAATGPAARGGAGGTPSSGAPAPRDSKGQLLDDRQKSQLDDMKKTDGDVRRHEQAHLSAAGGLARGGIVLDFKPGPDGKLYAVGGHVDIDTSPVSGNPAATITKMATVQRAALAPADPSGQDRSVAAQAARTANNARAQLARQQGPAGKGGTASGAAGGAGSSGGGLTVTIPAGSKQATPTGATAGAGQIVDVMG